MIAAIYARVSTADQNCEMQLRELREFIGRMKWEPGEEYVDNGFSGAKSSRPALNRLLADAAQRRFDVLLTWKLDRFGRSVRQLVDNIATLDRRGIRFVAPSQSIDTDEKSPTGRLIVNILAAVAEFERDLNSERVRAGIQQHKENLKLGRIGRDLHPGAARICDRPAPEDLRSASARGSCTPSRVSLRVDRKRVGRVACDRSQGCFISHFSNPRICDARYSAA